MFDDQSQQSLALLKIEFIYSRGNLLCKASNPLTQAVFLRQVIALADKGFTLCFQRASAEVGFFSTAH